MSRKLDATIQALVMVRLGQELGTDSRIAQAVASILDALISVSARFF